MAVTKDDLHEMEQAVNNIGIGQFCVCYWGGKPYLKQFVDSSWHQITSEMSKREMLAWLKAFRLGADIALDNIGRRS